MPSGVRENVLFAPPQKVELDAGGQEAEAGFGQLDPALAPEHAVEMALQIVQIEYVGRRVFELGVGNFFGTPVRALLLLTHVDVEELAHQILEAVPIRIGAD